MNNTDLYQRMSNPQAFKVFVHMLKNERMEIAAELFNNLQRDASDHPRYSTIVEVYNERINNKE